MTRAEALRISNLALASALMARAYIPGDAPEDHGKNTFGLPEGAPIRRTVRRFFREQAGRVAEFARKVGGSVPDRLPSLAHYAGPMASALAPVLAPYWERAGRALLGRLGLDPRSFRATDAEVHDAVTAQADRAAKTINATTEAKLARSLEALRVVRDSGQPGDDLATLAGSVFADALGPRARLIGRSEASTAVHSAAGMAAAGSGLVMAGRLVTNLDACPICLELAAETGWVPIGDGRLPIPPIHPNCMCSISYMLDDGSETSAFVPSRAAPASRPVEMAGSGGLAEGLSFTRTPAQVRRKDVLILADVARLDASLAADPGGFHVGPGGVGPSAVPGRYGEALRFLERARAEGIAVHATEVSVGKDGQAYINDGRHRFAALRDSGATAVPVAVEAGDAERFRRLFGAN